MNPCQLIDLVDMDNPWYLRSWRRAEMLGAPIVERLDRRLPPGVVSSRKWAVARLKSGLGALVKPRRRPGPSHPEGSRRSRQRPPRLEPGDIVRVKPLEEIRKTLDRNGMCGGLHFMPVQHQYCGRTFKVLKQVRTFLDERDFRVKRLNRVVLLEGVYCDGSPLEPAPCDRMCFLFWKEAWLERVGPDASPAAGGDLGRRRG